jgi:predicted amidohydrolase
MKRLLKLFTAVLLAGLIFPDTAIAENIIRNPGFEASVKTPQDWTITGPVPTMLPVTGVDNKVKFSGRQGLRMQSSNPNCHGKVVQTVDVRGDQTYLFTGRFRTEGVSSIDKSVVIRVKWFKEKEQIGYNYVYDVSDDANGWYKASDKIKSIAGATTAEISLVFRWTTGTIWWDDISMEACPDEPARSIKVSTVYFRPPGESVEKNISMMSDLIDQAGKAGTDILCLPEGWPTCGTGLGMTNVESNTLEGSASVMMAKKAKEYGMYIVSGLYSWVGDTLYNIAALYDRKGKIQGIYEKIQLPDAETEAGAVPGNTFPVFETDFGKIGILICWDMSFPEISRILAVNGAEMLLCPIWGDGRGSDGWKTIARARAMDNGVYFVTAIYDGHSLIVNPAGDVLQESGKQGTVITSTIDLNYNPPWDWLGNAGRGVWKGVWRKDRRSDVFGSIGEHKTSAEFK